MLKAGLIGYPLKKSLSQSLFRIFSALTGINISYKFSETRREDLSNAISNIRSENWNGFNITLPLKEVIIDYLDEIDAQADKIKSVNAVRLASTGLKGINTDVSGIKDAFHEKGFDVQGKTAVIWGAGAAARAAILFLIENGIREICVYNRSADRAKKILKIFNGISRAPFKIISLGEKTVSADIFINATPGGMYESINFNANFAKNSVCCDMAYLPGLTLLLQEAIKNGCKIIDGKEILICQALRSLEFWLDKPIGNVFDLKNKTLAYLKKEFAND